jgi:hypothetical protein
MSPLTITESGLEFGRFPEEDFFHVEQSTLCRGLGEGVKMVEFILVRTSGGKSSIMFVEAKSSVPRAGNEGGFDAYFGEIWEKMVNALTLLLAARLDRHGTAGDELPAGLRGVAFGTASVVFVLVIPAAPDEWLPDIQNKWDRTMMALRRTFGIEVTHAVVMNERVARAKRLVGL